MHGNYEFGGVEFFDINGTKILQAGLVEVDSVPNAGVFKQEIIIAEGERLLGVKSYLSTYPVALSPQQCDVKFIIGKLE